MKTIKLLREAVPMTQYELAMELGVVVATVSNWERGVTSPRPAQIRALAKVFGVSPQEIELPSKSVAA